MLPGTLTAGGGVGLTGVRVLVTVCGDEAWQNARAASITAVTVDAGLSAARVASWAADSRSVAVWWSFRHAQRVGLAGRVSCHSRIGCLGGTSRLCRVS